ncbi:MAG: RagB/SusD family nutrient uptake outer membrane protein [Prolixibacteraceae bacterium]
MKNYIILFVWSVLPLLLNSCGEDFLTKYPDDKISSGTFFKNETDFINAVNGVYDGLIKEGDSEFFPMNDMATPFANGGGGRFTIYKFGVVGLNSSWVRASEQWNTLYTAIGRANNLLANIDNKEAVISETMRNRIKGEALFIRAYAYFTLTYLMGDVPLITSPQKYEELLVSRTPKTEVINHIIDDLKSAETLLPSVKTYRGTKNLGRVSMGAAKSLLGKIYIYEKRWQEAKDKLLEVISSGDYVLSPNFSDQFWPAGENGPESIFELQYENYDTGSSDANKYVTFIGFTNLSNTAFSDGYNYINPTQYFADLYETKNGYKVNSTFNEVVVTSPYRTWVYNYNCIDPSFNPALPFDNRDPRLKWTIWYEDTPYITEFMSRTGMTGVNFKSRYIPESNYASVKYNIGKVGLAAKSPMNMIIIRYADVLLLYAEANIELNNLTEAVKYINMVRQRPSVMMPTVEQVGTITGTPIATDKLELTNFLRKERFRELAFEWGHMYSDMVRWDILAEETTAYWTANRDGFNNPALSSFSKDYYLWPIPQAEIVKNPNLTQNPGY